MNNYNKSISNLTFWIENPDIVTRLHSIEHGELRSGICEKKEGDAIVKSAMFYVVPSQVKSIDSLLNTYFCVDNPKEYLKFYYRYVKTYCNDMRLCDDDYFLSLSEIKYLLSLPTEKYNMNGIVSACQEGLLCVKEAGYWHDTDLRKSY